jgi:hypothetical protein
MKRIPSTSSSTSAAAAAAATTEVQHESLHAARSIIPPRDYRRLGKMLETWQQSLHSLNMKSGQL